MHASKKILISVLFVLALFTGWLLLELAYLTFGPIFAEMYCGSVANKLPENTKHEIVPAPIPEIGNGTTTRFYKTKWECEDTFDINLPLLNFLDNILST